MHAVVVTVKIAAERFDESRKALREEVVPRVKKAPGLVKGFWTVRADKSEGTSIVVFDTQQNAENAAGMVRSSPPPPGVTLNTVEIREVVAEA